MRRLPRNAHVALALSLALTGLTDQSNAYADASATTSPWKGSAELGVAATTGNSRNTSINAKFKLAYTQGPWSHSLRLETLQTSENGNSTANRSLAEFKSKYDLDKRDYLFGLARGIRDAFSGYTYQASVSGGYGRRLWVTDKSDLAVEAGPGYRRAKVVDTGVVQDDLVARIHGDFEYRFSSSAKFNQDLTVIGGRDNTETESVTALTASLVGSLAMKLSYTVQHNSNVPANTKKTDTFTSVNLLYSFK